MSLSTSSIAIIVSSLTFILLLYVLYVVFSKRGWNCTENGCVYVVGGSFDTYEKCNSTCKTNNSQKQVVSQSQNKNNPQIDSYENQYDYQINSCNPPDSKSSSNSNLNCNSQLDNCIGQNYLFPYQTHPYYSYLPGPFYHDNYWYRDKKHKKEKRKDSIKNHNENNIFINSPTGPNSI